MPPTKATSAWSAAGRATCIPRARTADHHVPWRRTADGSPLTGPVFERLINMPPDTNTLDLGTAPYVGLTYQRPVTLDTAKATLTRRASADGRRRPRPRQCDWAFADCTQVAFPGTPDPIEDLREGRLRSGVRVRARLHRQRSAGAGHRLRRHARPEFLPALRREGRHRRAQSGRRADQMGDQPRQIRNRAISSAASSISVSIRTKPAASCGTAPIRTSPRASSR